MKVLVAIPAYNCAAQIGRVLAAFTPAILQRIAAIIVIDNGSQDGTVAAAQAAAARLPGLVTVYRNQQNYGLGGTHKVAVLAARARGCDAVAILHGDDQAVAADLLSLLDALTAQPELVAVLGARFMPGSRLSGYSPLRIAGNRGLNVLYSLLTGWRTYDVGSGLNLFHLRLFADEAFLGFSDGFAFNPTLLLDCYQKRLPFKFLPIAWREEDQVSNARTFRVGFLVLKTLLAWRFGRLERLPRRAADYPSLPAEDLPEAGMVPILAAKSGTGN